MNVRLLRKIAKVIQDKPEQFDMAYFTGEGKCGTTHCIGGWAAVLSGRKESDTSVDEMADLLGISEEQSERLFYPDDSDTWNEFGGSSATAQQAASRIERFIATKGSE